MDNAVTSSLNPEQLHAVTLPPVSSLILAGAGSGKTRVLTNRIAYLIQKGEAMAGEILAVTFTNKAAREMEGRLGEMLTFNSRSMWIGTFHGLCNRMLRMNHEAAGLSSSFPILDMGEQLSMIKRVMKANQISDNVVEPKEAQRFINKFKEEGIRASRLKYEQIPNFNAKKHIYELYEKVLFDEGACDFAELLLRTYELLENNEHIRRAYQDRFRYILIDEFQDTNNLQYKWIKMLSGIEEPGCGAPNVVFAVGDDDQSIYAFRGANVGNMQDFVNDFGIGEPIRLEQNYRSQGNILKAANELIKHNSNRLGKNLWTSSGEGDKIRVFGAQRDFEESQYVVDTIKSLIDQGVEKKEIAILYRSNAQSRSLESEFVNRKIPYRIYGGLRFWDRAEIKHALAYMRLVENTEDDSAFLRVVNFPSRKIGAKTVENLIDFAKQHNLSLYDACFMIGGQTSAKVKPFIDIIDALRLDKMQLTLRAFTEETLKKSGLLDYYRAEKNGEDKVENLNELTSAAQMMMLEHDMGKQRAGAPLEEGGTVLGMFLSSASLDSGDREDPQNNDVVQLMTVHASKGLEFKKVFITGLEEGLFPHDNSIRYHDQKQLEEERRLMYVAITRAKESLYLTYAQQRMLNGSVRNNPRSRFFKEIPSETLKWLTPEKDSSFSSYEDSFDRMGDFGRGSSSFARDLRRGYQKDVEATRRSGYSGGRFSESFSTPKSDKMRADMIRANQDPSNPFKAGVKIMHEKFGPGTILSTEGSGDTHMMEIKFQNSGKKLKLLTKIAGKKMKIV